MILNWVIRWNIVLPTPLFFFFFDWLWFPWNCFSNAKGEGFMPKSALSVYKTRSSIVLHHKYIRLTQTALSATRRPSAHPPVTSVSASDIATAQIKPTLSKSSVWRAETVWFLEDLNVVFDNVKCGFGNDDRKATLERSVHV